MGEAGLLERACRSAGGGRRLFPWDPYINRSKEKNWRKRGRDTDERERKVWERESRSSPRECRGGGRGFPSQMARTMDGQTGREGEVLQLGEPTSTLGPHMTRDCPRARARGSGSPKLGHVMQTTPTPSRRSPPVAQGQAKTFSA